ncbi:hypothetical protein KO507_13260 [Gilvimarinus agarilyticus]|uniref:hypothetical protein n=1 Tax=Gilvimarinus sp. 2_MG-2023 TaxID=3062666 RepID=UPI001C09DAF9|nr:hypothetical protein [Gilvimarinus sp. 2_MG-2023]MBU2886736.1 hypothetical protein [Gilvimarinus agarilyticus]MDO6571402.1 hypothetical protein [Gilvimarinus sp. 2_MG-2023]
MSPPRKLVVLLPYLANQKALAEISERSGIPLEVLESWLENDFSELVAILAERDDALAQEMAECSRLRAAEQQRSLDFEASVVLSNLATVATGMTTVEEVESRLNLEGLGLDEVIGLLRSKLEVVRGLQEVDADE